MVHDFIRFSRNLIQVNRPILQLGKTVKKSKLHHWFLVEFQSDNLKSYVSPGWERSRESLAMQQILPDETALKLRSSQFPELQLTFLWGLQMPFPISPICGFTETSYCKHLFLPKSASPLILLCYNNNSLYLLKIFCLKNGTKSFLTITSKWIITLNPTKQILLLSYRDLQLRKLRHKVTTQLRVMGPGFQCGLRAGVLGLLI